MKRVTKKMLAKSGRCDSPGSSQSYSRSARNSVGENRICREKKLNANESLGKSVNKHAVSGEFGPEQIASSNAL